MAKQGKGRLNELTEASRKGTGRRPQRTETCPDCRGQMVRHFRNLAGKRMEETCKRCGGKGTVQQ